MNFKEHVFEYFGISLSDRQIDQFELYYQFLIEYNKITNLTRIDDRVEVYYKHFFDSLTPIRENDFLKTESVCDMGAGAGFPSIPIKIVFPHLKITIIDALGKRIVFLKRLVEKLELSDVTLIHDRIEVAAKSMQNKFDVVLSRALAHMRTTLEFGIPMNKINGISIMMKATSFQIEIEESKNALKMLAAKIVKIDSFDLPNEYGFRTNVFVKKTEHINGFPRTYQQIIKKPL
ncbi:MAG: 16S rRNA (guanine(527)-N(7))-methyltransferase RsmG [Acholeplasmataceae bacterium]